MASTINVDKLPKTINPDLDLEQVKQDCQQLVKKQAKISAGVAIVPIPLFDLVIDAGLLTKLLPEISQRFGLIEDSHTIDLNQENQFEQYKNRAREFAGLMATRGLVKKTIQGFGGRIVAQQVTKFVPFGGQIVSATMGYMIFKKIAFDHIEECYKLAKKLQKEQHAKNI